MVQRSMNSALPDSNKAFVILTEAVLFNEKRTPSGTTSLRRAAGSFYSHHRGSSLRRGSGKRRPQTSGWVTQLWWDRRRRNAATVPAQVIDNNATIKMHHVLGDVGRNPENRSSVPYRLAGTCCFADFFFANGSSNTLRGNCFGRLVRRHGSNRLRRHCLLRAAARFA